jgi:hypothetical protein
MREGGREGMREGGREGMREGGRRKGNKGGPSCPTERGRGERAGPAPTHAGFGFPLLRLRPGCVTTPRRPMEVEIETPGSLPPHPPHPPPRPRLSPALPSLLPFPRQARGAQNNAPPGRLAGKQTISDQRGDVCFAFSLRAPPPLGPTSSLRSGACRGRH